VTDAPLIVTGFVQTWLPVLAASHPDGSVILVEEPDVVRKRDIRAKLPQFPVIRELIEWEYHLPAAADAFANRYADLRPAAVIPMMEYTTPFVARLAERYGVPGAGFGAASLLRDKAQLRTATRAAGIANPQSRPAAGPGDIRAFLADLGAPVVLKPANRQAAIGTMIVRTPDEADAAWQACLVQDEGIVVPDRPIPLRMLVEQYLSGPEFSVEMLVRDGRPVFANVTGKVVFPGPRPVERGHAVPADIPDRQAEALRAETVRVLDAVGFGTGVVHCEWILVDDVPYLVECAGRLPGDGIIDLIELAYPAQLYRDYYTLLEGRPLPDPLPERPAGAAAVWFLHAGAGEVEAVAGVAEARQVPGVTSCGVTVHPGDRTHELRSSWDRIGSAIATASTPAEALDRARRAVDRLTVRVRPAGEPARTPVPAPGS